MPDPQFAEPIEKILMDDHAVDVRVVLKDLQKLLCYLGVTEEIVEPLPPVKLPFPSHRLVERIVDLHARIGIVCSLIQKVKIESRGNRIGIKNREN
jgi:hypothetical protein